ncbi:Tol-Pal system beta propeller repeat protein TolB [Candidatus Nitrospira nitrificans]|uniref:TolB protein, periplasmic protein involved in the tonb-independent uptake of group A colicins n=1 Tax=Candidatus Nitrospira nitrificans TaxID=1742973 RepID=A0A0S4L2U2_9BACT|nr:Tol-Pal system beta propeller repeat protein TolB [Candidatus Nitrospira nitrificans]CUS31969.1 TolB protein, periplasmic protein involved in the tonb-independent uptake of group A colicins [Candidatus Nitrospira nitrificans]
MTFRVVVLVSLCVSIGVAWIIESGAADVFLEATRSDFQKIPLGIAGIENLGGSESPEARVKLGTRIEDVLKADVRRSLVFALVDLPSLGIKVGHLGAEPDPSFKRAAENGVSVIVWGQAGMKSGSKDADLSMDGYVYDAGNNEVVGGKRYVGSTSVARLMAHRFADELVFRYTGEPGIARTKIAYVSELGTARELFVMDYDGYDPRQLTADGFLNLMPRWSPDRRFLVFTTYRNRNTQDIDMIELATGKRWTLVAQGGLNITPVLSPDGNSLAYSSSHEGNAELYRLDTKTKAVQRLTTHAAGDLSPSWSPSGRELVFTSDRSGGPQIFLMSADGSNVRRLTFEGDYNAAPAWSPRGNWIAYVCRTPKKEYKLCVITPDGQKRLQLTTGLGVDDSPSWSPDGRHLVFSSTVEGKSQIYMIDADGKDLERITFTGTHNSAPSWSPAS